MSESTTCRITGFVVHTRLRCGAVKNTIMYICEVETSVPLPMEGGNYSTPLRERTEAACQAAKLLVELGSPLGEPDLAGGKDMLESIAKEVEPSVSVAKGYLSSNANAIYLGGLLNAYDMLVVQDAAQLRTYVTNKLVAESDNPDARIRMQALKMLGQITDVGLFTEKTEITINNRANGELENLLREKLNKLSGKTDAIDAEIITQPPQPLRIIDLNEEFRALDDERSLDERSESELV